MARKRHRTKTKILRSFLIFSRLNEPNISESLFFIVTSWITTKLSIYVDWSSSILFLLGIEGVGFFSLNEFNRKTDNAQFPDEIIELFIRKKITSTLKIVLLE
ncbi:MAG: hypothetical protein ACOCU7_08020, partial [Tangfeifania sp.]